MDNYRSIFWGHGQFLSPQHLQQQDLYHQTILRKLWQISNPYGWGLTKLSVREEGLENSSFEITECEFVTRDGQYIRAGTQSTQPNAILHSRRFDGILDPSKGDVPVYLAITKHQPGQNNLAKNADPIPTGQLAKRYVLAVKEQEDQYDLDASEANVIYVDYYLAIYFGNEELFHAAEKTLDAFQIAELTLSGEQSAPRLSRNFIPPHIQLSGSDVLLGLIKNIRDLLAGRSQEFASLVRQSGVRATSSGSQELLRTFMLQSLNRYIPSLQHFIEDRKSHPEKIYLELRKLVGELSVFSEDYTVFGATAGQKGGEDALPPYDHDNLWKCFQHTWLRIRELVIAMTSGPEQSVTLEFDGAEYYKADLTQDFFGQTMARFYLMIDSIVPGNEVWTRLQRTGKISSYEEISKLRSSAVFGLKIEYMPNPPEELPQRSSRYTYFRIDTASPPWRTIQANKNISVFCDLDPEDTVIKIVRVGGN